MADIIKKITAFPTLEASAMDGNEQFLIARDNKNHKVSFDAIFNATDLRMSHNSLVLEKLTEWTKQNFVTQDYAYTYMPTNNDVANLVYTETSQTLAKLSYTVNYELPEWVNKRIGDDINWALEHIDEFAPHIAVYDKVYTKDETQEIVSNMLNDFEQEMHLSYHNSISRIENDMSILQDELNRIDENNNALVQTKELVDNTILTTGEGKLFLADDGKYHDIGELELISYGVATITNDDIDENGIGKVNIRIPILPKTHTLHFDVKLPYTTFNQIYAKGVKVWSEFNKFEKNWFDNRTMFKVAFDNNVLQFKQGNEEQQMISNLIKSRTYFDEDEVKDTLIIRPTLIDIIHEEYNATIEIKLEGKIPDNATSPILVTYHIFGDIYK